MASVERSSIASRSILLINPPSPPGLAANREGAGGLGAWGSGEAGFIYPPQALAYAAAVLRSAGWTVRLLDAAGERLGSDAAMRRIREQPLERIIAVQVASISLDNDIGFLERLRAVAPRSRLLAIGVATAFVAPQLLERTDVDHVVVGEPEAMLLPTCQVLAGESEVRRLHRRVTPADLSVAGVDGEGRLLDLDTLPFPAWDLVPLERYGFVTMLVSRGCDDTCAFCPYVVGQGRHLRSRQPEHVVDEMAWLAATVRLPRLILRDPVFAYERARVERICQGVIERKVRLAWECESRPEHFDASLLRLMRRAGCVAVKLGLETTSEHVLRSLRRIAPTDTAGAYLQQTATVVAACRMLGIACRLFVMTGLPGQTDEDIVETIDFLRQVRPTSIHVKPFYRYPGLPMPGAATADDRQRGERQAALMSAAVAPTLARPSFVGKARRWLARRLQR